MAPTTDLQETVGRLIAGDPQLMASPYPIWNQVRDTTAALRVGGAVVVTRHQHVRAAMSDYHVNYSRAAMRHAKRYEDARLRFEPEERSAFDRVLGQEFRQLVRLDPPDHQRLRRVVQPAFAMKRLKDEMDSVVRARVESEIARLRLAGPIVDFTKLAYTLPLTVLGDLLGIPLPDLDQVHSWANKIGANKNNANSGQAALDAADAYEHLDAYIETLMARQAASDNAPGLVGAILDAEASGRIDHDDALNMLVLLIFAGHETTSNLLSIGLLMLLEHRPQWDLLCDDPAIAHRGVEELLRFVTPVHFVQYVAREPQSLDGEEIQAGETIMPVMAAANRDPSVFDRPDELDLLRADSGDHLALGVGPHFCLGAGVARMEGALLFAALASEFPNLELATTDLSWTGSAALRTLVALPIRLK